MKVIIRCEMCEECFHCNGKHKIGDDIEYEYEMIPGYTHHDFYRELLFKP